MSVIVLVSWLSACGPSVDKSGDTARVYKGGTESLDGYALRVSVEVDGIGVAYDGHKNEPFIATAVHQADGADCTPATMLYVSMEWGGIAPIVYDMEPDTVTAVPQLPFGRSVSPVRGVGWPGEEADDSFFISGGMTKIMRGDAQTVVEVNGGRLCVERSSEGGFSEMTHDDCDPFVQALITIEGPLGDRGPVEGIGRQVLPSGEALCAPAGGGAPWTGQ